MNPTILNREFQHPSDGWYMIEAKGQHPNRAAGVVQIIDDEATQSIVNRFNADAEAGNLRHGNELLIDHEHFSDQPDKETRAYGWLGELTNRADGIYGRIRWTKTGKDAVDGGDYRFFSTEYNPEDLAEVPSSKLQNSKSKVRAVRPLRLGGLSLTNMNNNRGQKPITNRGRILNGDLPGHEFHGNQYSASEHIEAQPGYRKTLTDKKTGVQEHFIHTNATTPRNAAENFTKEARAKGADQRTRTVSSDASQAEVVVHNNGQVHRVHFVKGYDQKTKNRIYRHGTEAEAGIQTNNQRTKMQSVAMKLGLSAEASEEAILAEVTKIQNRANTAETALTPAKNRVTELETENKTLLDEQVDGLLSEHGVKEEKVINRLKPLLMPLKNRADRVQALADLNIKPGTAPQGGSEQRKLHNRDTKAPNGGKADEGTDAAERATATKISNRALQIQKEMPTVGLATAYQMAENEIVPK